MSLRLQFSYNCDRLVYDWQQGGQRHAVYSPAILDIGERNPFAMAEFLRAFARLIEEKAWSVKVNQEFRE